MTDNENQSAAVERIIEHNTTDNEKLIEEAAKAIGEAREVVIPRGDGYVSVTDADDATLARAALAVFEKAHTPTGDEREALANLIQLGYVTDWYEAADRILAAGFRRSEVPEPSARKLTPCGNIVCTGCRVCGCPALGIPPEPQGEPSDAQVDAAMNAFYGKTDASIAHPFRKDMRAALRAAGGVR